jgi:nucleoside-diphosphate-sugar epimerase
MNHEPGLVLITGAAGRVGQAAVGELLARGHKVRGFDRAPTPGVTDAFTGSITDAVAVARAFAGVHTSSGCTA